MNRETGDFNSSKVRLKDNQDGCENHYLMLFQSSKVRLKGKRISSLRNGEEISIL